MQCRDQLLEDVPALKEIYEQMHQIRVLMKHRTQSKSACRGHINEMYVRIRWLRESALGPLQTLANSLTEWIEPLALNVAVFQKQWNNGRLPSQNEIDPAKSLRV